MCFKPDTPKIPDAPAVPDAVAGAVVAAPTLALAVPSPMTLEEVCDYQAGLLRDALQKLHGGMWDCHINHRTKAAFVICKHA